MGLSSLNRRSEAKRGNVVGVVAPEDMYVRHGVSLGNDTPRLMARLRAVGSGAAAFARFLQVEVGC